VLAVLFSLGVIASPDCRPFGMFTASFMLVSSTFARQPALSIVLVAGLLIAFGALILRLQDIVFGEPTARLHPAQASYIPAYVHLMIVLIAGLWLPGPVVQWFAAVARCWDDGGGAGAIATILAGLAPVGFHAPWRRFDVDAEAGPPSPNPWQRRGGPARTLGDVGAVHMALRAPPADPA